MLYLGAASGTTVSHVSDIVGPVSYIGVLNGQMMRSLDFPPNYGMRKSSLLKGYVRL